MPSVIKDLVSLTIRQISVTHDLIYTFQNKALLHIDILGRELFRNDLSGSLRLINKEIDSIIKLCYEI